MRFRDFIDMVRDRLGPPMPTDEHIKAAIRSVVGVGGVVVSPTDLDRVLKLVVAEAYRLATVDSSVRLADERTATAYEEA